VRQIIFAHFEQIVDAWGSNLEGSCTVETEPVLAKAIETTPDALIVIMQSGPISIPWEQCSERLAQASPLERDRAMALAFRLWHHCRLIDETWRSVRCLRVTE